MGDYWSTARENDEIHGRPTCGGTAPPWEPCHGGAKQLHRDAIIGRYGILTIDCQQPQLVPRSMVTGAPLSHLPRARAIDILQVACSLCLFFLLSYPIPFLLPLLLPPLAAASFEPDGGSLVRGLMPACLSVPPPPPPPPTLHPFPLYPSPGLLQVFALSALTSTSTGGVSATLAGQPWRGSQRRGSQGGHRRPSIPGRPRKTGPMGRRPQGSHREAMGGQTVGGHRRPSTNGRPREPMALEREAMRELEANHGKQTHRRPQGTARPRSTPRRN